MEVAKALIASGLDKAGRVGILMTNRPEYLSAVFGTALAGGVSVGLSTFSTTNEMDYLLAASGVSFVLFDGRILKRDFGAMLAELEPQIHRVAPGDRKSVVSGKSVSGRVDLGGRRIIKQKKQRNKQIRDRIQSNNQ